MDSIRPCWFGYAESSAPPFSMGGQFASGAGLADAQYYFKSATVMFPGSVPS